MSDKRRPLLTLSGESSQILIQGAAGQGIVFAGIVLARAAAETGYQVAQSALFGAAVQAGEAAAHVRLSKGPIPYPFVESPDLVIALSQEAYERHTSGRGSHPAIIYDRSRVCPKDSREPTQMGVPASDTVAREFSGTLGANMVLLGAMSAATEIVPLEAMKRQLTGGSERAREINLFALDAGSALSGTPFALPQVRSSSERVRVDEGRCGALTSTVDSVPKGRSAADKNPQTCRICELICPDLAISRDRDSGLIQVDAHRCKGCGLCIHLCPRNALYSSA